jgi:hypothetical protein
MSAFGEYRLVEAIVSKLQTLVSVADMTGDQLSAEYAKQFKIGASLPNVKGRTPYLAVNVDSTIPLNQQARHTGWMKSVVELCAFSRDELVCTLIGDAIINEVVHELHGMSSNRAYLNFTNDHITNSGTTFIRRNGIEFNDGQDYYESSLYLEVIWLDRPCEGDSRCPSVDLTCPDQVDCSDCSE